MLLRSYLRGHKLTAHIDHDTFNDYFVLQTPMTSWAVGECRYGMLSTMFWIELVPNARFLTQYCRSRHMKRIATRYDDIIDWARKGEDEWWSHWKLDFIGISLHFNWTFKTVNSPLPETAANTHARTTHSVTKATPKLREFLQAQAPAQKFQSAARTAGSRASPFKHS